MSRQVRWRIQVALKSGRDANGQQHELQWIDRADLTYSDWFYSDGEDKESESLIYDYNQAVETQPHLDVRIVKDIRSINVVSAYAGKIGVIRSTVEEL